MKLSELTELSTERAITHFFRCCGCRTWAEEMAERRPFESPEELFSEAEKIWWDLGRDEWLEAFSAHPKIGDIDSLREKYASTKSWSEDEQSGVATADEQVLERLAEANDEYEQRFGYIFIVCATGKSAAEMLALLEERLHNDPDDELEIAAGEQAKITRIRLQKLLEQ